MKKPELQASLEANHYDMYLSLMFYRKMAVTTAHRLLEQFDRRMARKLLGRNFHRPCKFEQRIAYWAAAEQTKETKHRHYHLLLSFPNAEMQDKFIQHLEETWAQTIDRGTASIDAIGPFIDIEKHRMVDYGLKELPVDKFGHVDTSKQMYSRSYRI